MKALQVPKQNKVHLIGVELEGGWDECPNSYQDDGSVECAGDTTGECISSPLKLVDVLRWIPRNYPEYTNDTCGFHVHTSYNDLRDYETLMERKFYDFFLARITHWGKSYPIKNRAFWTRLDGKNSYCRKTFVPMEQALVNHKGGPRYSLLNYCWGLHGTLECRLFPMFKSSKTAQAAVCELVDLIETYLVMHRPTRTSIVSNFVPTRRHQLIPNPVNKKVGERLSQKDRIEMEFPEQEVEEFVLHRVPEAGSPAPVAGMPSGSPFAARPW